MGYLSILDPIIPRNMGYLPIIDQIIPRNMGYLPIIDQIIPRNMGYLPIIDNGGLVVGVFLRMVSSASWTSDRQIH